MAAPAEVPPTGTLRAFRAAEWPYDSLVPPSTVEMRQLVAAGEEDAGRALRHSSHSTVGVGALRGGSALVSSAPRLRKSCS
jgi:hypothetical protein